MRFRFLFVILPPVLAVAGCGLGNDDCSGRTLVASATPSLPGSSVDAWTQESCTSAESDVCSRGIPPGNSLMLCTHERDLVATDGGSFQALGCDFYSDAKSCHSSGVESHAPRNLPVPPPPG